jgi:hypothetical protein
MKTLEPSNYMHAGEFCLLGCKTVQSVESQPTLPRVFTMVSCSACSSTLEEEATCSSDMSVYFEVEVEVNLRPTVSRPVRLGIGPPFGALDQILSCSSFFC